MRAGHDLVYAMAEASGGEVDEAQWRGRYLARHPWVDKHNLKPLFSTGMYDAWKNGVATDDGPLATRHRLPGQAVLHTPANC